MAFEDYSIQQYYNAKFRKDYSQFGIPEDIFDTVETEYVDASGLYESEEFENVSYIHYLNGRINKVSLFIKLQRDFIKEFGIPFLPDISRLKEIGHNLFWDGDLPKFENQLSKIESREKKYVSKLEGKIKLLTEKRKIKNGDKHDEETIEGRAEKLKNDAVSFIRTLNTLGKTWSIDKYRTSLQEYGIMIKQQMEEVQASRKH